MRKISQKYYKISTENKYQITKMQALFFKHRCIKPKLKNNACHQHHGIVQQNNKVLLPEGTSGGRR